jgi:hypothetical protein
VGNAAGFAGGGPASGGLLGAFLRKDKPPRRQDTKGEGEGTAECGLGNDGRIVVGERVTKAASARVFFPILVSLCLGGFSFRGVLSPREFCRETRFWRHNSFARELRCGAAQERIGSPGLALTRVGVRFRRCVLTSMTLSCSGEFGTPRREAESGERGAGEWDADERG